MEYLRTQKEQSWGVMRVKTTKKSSILSPILSVIFSLDLNFSSSLLVPWEWTSLTSISCCSVVLVLYCQCFSLFPSMIMIIITFLSRWFFLFFSVKRTMFWKTNAVFFSSRMHSLWRPPFLLYFYCSPLAISGIPSNCMRLHSERKKMFHMMLSDAVIDTHRLPYDST